MKYSICLLGEVDNFYTSAPRTYILNPLGQTSIHPPRYSLKTARTIWMSLVYRNLYSDRRKRIVMQK